MATLGRLVGGGEFLSGKSAQATGGISKTSVVQSGGWPLLAVLSAAVNSLGQECPSYGRDLKNARRSIRRMATLGRLVGGGAFSRAGPSYSFGSVNGSASIRAASIRSTPVAPVVRPPILVSPERVRCWE